MNPDFSRMPRPEVEERLTALLLGELDPATATALRAHLETDPELAQLAARLSATLGFVRDAEARPVKAKPGDAGVPEGPRLSEPRREALLRRLRGLPEVGGGGVLATEPAAGPVVIPVRFEEVPEDGRERSGSFSWLAVAAVAVAALGLVTVWVDSGRWAVPRDIVLLSDPRPGTLTGTAVEARDSEQRSAGVPVTQGVVAPNGRREMASAASDGRADYARAGAVEAGAKRDSSERARVSEKTGDFGGVIANDTPVVVANPSEVAFAVPVEGAVAIPPPPAAPAAIPAPVPAPAPASASVSVIAPSGGPATQPQLMRRYGNVPRLESVNGMTMSGTSLSTGESVATADQGRAKELPELALKRKDVAPMKQYVDALAVADPAPSGANRMAGEKDGFGLLAGLAKQQGTDLGLVTNSRAAVPTTWAFQNFDADGALPAASAPATTYFATADTERFQKQMADRSTVTWNDSAVPVLGDLPALGAAFGTRGNVEAGRPVAEEENLRLGFEVANGPVAAGGVAGSRPRGASAVAPKEPELVTRAYRLNANSLANGLEPSSGTPSPGASAGLGGGGGGGGGFGGGGAVGGLGGSPADRLELRELAEAPASVSAAKTEAVAGRRGGTVAEEARVKLRGLVASTEAKPEPAAEYKNRVSLGKSVSTLADGVMPEGIVAQQEERLGELSQVAPAAGEFRFAVKAAEPAAGIVSALDDSKSDALGRSPARPAVQRELARTEESLARGEKLAALASDKKNVDAAVRSAAVPVSVPPVLSVREVEPTPAAKPAVVRAPVPVPQPEVATAENAFSTFSLNVADVSFKLAAASLENGALPDPGTIRSEEFLNAFNYRDPDPAPGAPVAFAWERARYPFAHNRDALRLAVRTAALGREAGRPLHLVLVLDSSGSMERADRVRIVREALVVLSRQLHAADRISVVSFARTARLWVDALPGNQAAELPDRVGNLAPEGGTNLGEALRVAYETARKNFLPDGVNRVVLLTDGAANLGDVDPASLQSLVETNRRRGVALDAFGIGWEGYNDDLLEVLTRNGDGRYGFINTPEEAASGFAAQLAGALQVAAADVKVQVEFNPARVTTWRQIGYARHQLTKEQFRDNTVDAAEIGAAESGNALYLVEPNPSGEGPLATVRVRFRVPSTGLFEEHAWTVPYSGAAPALDQAAPSLRLAATSAAFAESLAGSPFAAEVNPDRLLPLLSGVPETFQPDPRPARLEWMIRQVKVLGGAR